MSPAPRSDASPSSGVTVPRPLTATARTYLIAGLAVECDVDLPLQAAPDAPGRTVNFAVRRSNVPSPDDFGLTLYDADAQLGNLRSRVVCRFGPSGTLLDIEGAGRFSVSADGRWAGFCPDANAASRDLETALLGPVLALCLAHLGVVLLHASGTAEKGGSILYLGDSGSGKSTLARHLIGISGAGTRRVSDDIVPAELGPHGAAVLPHYPQLKLPPTDQWAATDPPSLEWTRAYFLAEGPEIEVRHLQPHAAAAMLLTHVVALPLFDPDLRQRVVEQCAAFATQVPMAVLSYPRRLEALPDVARVLAEAPGRRQSGPTRK